MKLMSMSAQEIILFGALTELAKEAAEAEELIKKHFDCAFGIGKTQIEVYHTESCSEYYGDGYLTIGGVFKYHDNWWGGRDYEFRVDADGIYKMLRSCYLRENKLERLDPEKFDTRIDMAHYFRDFINKLRTK